ncbi:MAG: PAS domain-containing protein [Xanthomonadales bacterium]|nr:PAS domain-containing protein [Xanthomonadales bacterium]
MAWRSCCALLVVGLALALAPLAHALAPGVDQVRFRVYNEDDGLPQSSVSALVEDDLGFVWLGTQDGLARFDGHEFRILRRDSERTDSLADNYVQALALSGDSLWVASPALGLSQVDVRSLRTRRLVGERARAMGLGEDGYSGLHVDSQARLWVSQRSLGVRLYDAAADRFIDPPFQIPFERRQRVLGESRSHGLLIAVDDDLWRWREGAAERIYVAEAGAHAPVLAVVDAGIDQLWVATQGNGLLLLDGQGVLRQQLRRTDGLVDDEVLRLLLDRRGRLWTGHVGGLCLLDQTRPTQCWQHQPSAAGGLPGNRITALLEDRQGHVWVGTWTGGVGIHAPDDERFLRVGVSSAAAGLPTQAVASISQAAAGGYWLSLIDGGGLLRFDLQQGVLQRWEAVDPALQQVTPLVSLSDADTLWVGTSNAGLLRLLSDGTVRHYPPRPEDPTLGPPGRMVQSLYTDPQGRLWLGTAGDGLAMLCRDCERFRHYRSDPEDVGSLSSASINDVLQTRDGRVWVALRRGGVNRLDPQTGRVERFRLRTADGDIEFSATALLEDRAGRLWVGTQGFGLLQLLRNEQGEFVGFRELNVRQGLPAESIGAMLEDAAGWLWVSTTAGLARVQPEQGRAESWRPFSRGRGEDYFVGSALADSDGRFLFGGVSGMTVFRPDEVLLTDAPPDAIPADIYVDQQSLPLLAAGATADRTQDLSLQLPHPQALLGVELATQPLLTSAPVRFAYRLDPQDDDWTLLPRNRRQVILSHLEAGQYTLKLRARFDEQENWGAISQIDLVVLPPWWRSQAAMLAFLLAALLALGSMGWMARRYLRERRAASRALAQSNTLLKESLWGSQGELWDCDLRSGQIVRENRLPHLKVDQVGAPQTLRGLRPFVHLEDQASFDAALRACVEGEREFLHVSYRTQDADDQWRWMLTRGKLLERDDGDRPVRLVGTTFDVTELRAQEDALRESQARLRMALWGSGDELWDLDVRANRVHRENPLPRVRLSQDLRFSDALEYLDLAHEQDRPGFRQALTQHVLGRTDSFEASFRLPAVEGGWVWVLSRGRAVDRDEQGHASRVVGTNRDITVIKQTEAELKALNDQLEARVGERTWELEQSVQELRATLQHLQAAQAQLVDAEKMAALGNLVAGVTHDINTPVGIAVTAASNMREEAARLHQALDAQRLKRSELAQFVALAQQSSAMIETNLQRASHLLRSFKQVAVDQASEQVRVIDLAAYIDEILRSLGPELRHHHVQVCNRCPPGLQLRTYPGAIYQIVANLVLNASVHAFDDGAMGEIEIAAVPDEGGLQLSVSDNGRGMEEGVSRHIFEPFFTTRRESGGSGLGLHIVYNLCTEVLGGTIRCLTAPGQGARFEMRLPAQVDASVEAP